MLYFLYYIYIYILYCAQGKLGIWQCTYLHMLLLNAYCTQLVILALTPNNFHEHERTINTVWTRTRLSPHSYIFSPYQRATAKMLNAGRGKWAAKNWSCVSVIVLRENSHQWIGAKIKFAIECDLWPCPSASF